MDDPVILRASSLTKSYPRRDGGVLTILNQVTFEIEVGATVAIVGPSGSGKTTLLSLCAGLDRPTAGTVRLCGQPLETMDEDALARLRLRSVGFVFQTFRLIPTLTALENVMVPLELDHALVDVDEARMQAADLLGRVGLRERLDHYPAQLSGGEQQRVALARAFVHRPAILFADEPTGNLDAETSAGLIDLLFALNADRGTTLVLVTHDLDLAQRTGRILRLRHGAIVGDERLKSPLVVKGRGGP